MASIESKKVSINKSAKEVSAFIANLNNMEKLLPEGKTKDWTSNGTECSFKIEGLSRIGMKLNEVVDGEKVILGSHGKNPFDFTLNVSLKSLSETSCEAQLICDADVNPFVKMMIEKPLGNFFNSLAEKMERI